MSAHELHDALVERFGTTITGEVQVESLSVDRDGERNNQMMVAKPLLQKLVSRLRAIEAREPAPSQEVVTDFLLPLVKEWNEAREKNRWPRLAILREPEPG
jgi:hypothetical protein